ncbi:hypothetical protein ABIA35_004467 [Catenulispora sp. MAP12-49]|uniref:TIR domain-containing protein n=1 Tax=unclassified Catenulispora TaxID=414885 RepID=UPI0035113970
MSDHAPVIFISYRGSDEPWAPDVLYQGLAAAFGPEAVFKAGYDLRAGDDYPPVLERMAASCRIMLVCIGPRWLTAANAAGTRRLQEKDDWVRREIELALRSDNHVIPLLMGNRDEVVVPAPEELPADIAPLVQRQAFRLEPGGRLRVTLPDLAQRLCELVPALATPKPVAATMSVTQRVGTLAGRATLVRAPEEFVSQGDFAQEIDSVSETGDAIALDLLRTEGS